ncbi:hypothetical protein ACOP1M_00055 [Staphylococcus warneri]|uniref:hypothetical protein n=1 Tax=Staphylococcus warneri TaxID=1292 RepID=UPI003CF72059
MKKLEHVQTNTYEELEKAYKDNVININNMMNFNFNHVSKNLIERAYDIDDIEILSVIVPLDTVTDINGDEYVVEYITEDNQKAVLHLDGETNYFTELIGELERELILPWECIGRLFECDDTMIEFVEENLRLVSEIGFEIYQFTDEENIFLGMPSVASSGIVEYFTPLYFAWQQWKENDLLKLKGAFK